jgi:hypothetical protein
MTVETKIFESTQGVEQRRPIRNTPLIELEKQILYDSTDAQSILSVRPQTIYIPIDVEFFVGSRVGSTVVTTEATIQYFFFLKYIRNMYLMDADGNTAKINSVAGGTITLASPISGTSNNFYTAMKVYTKSLEFQYITDTIAELKMQVYKVIEDTPLVTLPSVWQPILGDNWEGLDGLAVFLGDAEWATAPIKKKSIFVIEDIYPGTIHSLDFYREPARELKFTITGTKENIYPLLIFFADVQGRYKKFWMPDLFKAFNILEIVPGGTDILKVEKVSNITLHGGELLYLELNNGNRLSRNIKSITHEPTYTAIEITSLPIPALPLLPIAIGDIKRCSLMYLGRFNQDSLDLTYDTDDLVSCVIEFIELAKEYP